MTPQEEKIALEKAASEYAGYNFDSALLDIDDHFIAGAEWQAKIMYSEDEVNKIIDEIWDSYSDYRNNEKFSEVRHRIIEKFKKA